ncbi:MAG: hypothetical protein WBN04_10030 [Paracoccaceae bacterium]
MPAFAPARLRGQVAQNFGFDASDFGHLPGRTALQMLPFDFPVISMRSKMRLIARQIATPQSIARQIPDLVPGMIAMQASFWRFSPFATPGFPDAYTLFKGHFESDSVFHTVQLIFPAVNSTEAKA